MTPPQAQILDGLALSRQLRVELSEQCRTLRVRGIVAGLAVVLVGENPASQVYVRNKVKACAEVGIYSVLEQYPDSLSEAALLERIAALNANPSIHGILVQLPLPAHIDAHKVIESIAPHKDVDGFHVANAGALMVGQPGFWPCTPYGCMKMLEHIQMPLRGKHAVVIGRSNIVGKPMAMMLLQQDATVTLCHSRTIDLKAQTLQADIIIAAVGKRNILTADMVKPGAVVIDVGMNRTPEGKLCGDVDFEQVRHVAAHITPVPGGVGPMTITMLLVNTLQAAQQASPNPLLEPGTLPRFDAIGGAHVASALQTLLREADQALQAATQPEFPAQWEALSRVLGVATERLARAWGAVGHLNAVADTPELRAAYNAQLPAVTEFWTRLGGSEALYAKYKAMDPTTLDAAQAQALRNALRDFVLGGAELQGDARTRFAAIQEALAGASQKFSENTLDATDAYRYFASAEEVAGLPSDVVDAARAAAQALGQEGYCLTLKMPSYLPVMQFAHDRALRARLYRAYVTRASEQAENDARRFDNSDTMRQILALRQEEAALLGYPHYGALSLASKMAPSTDAVLQFLRDLAQKARAHAQADLDAMRSFAQVELGIADPQAWDWPYIGEKLKEQRFAFSDQEVRPYFPSTKVLQGLFQIVGRLFDVAIEPDTAPAWNPQVAFYRIVRKDNAGVAHTVGQFYLDPSARNGKRGGAWMDDVCGRWLRPDTGQLQTPVAHLVCNFPEGSVVDGVIQPALLTHNEVITLFHEFGHGLHHLLTQVDELAVSGINGVEWDAVELPSQFMENFCWEWKVLEGMTGHVHTGESLPRALYDKMLAARNFQSGLQTLRQIEFGLFDMLLHTTHPPEGDIQTLLQQVRDEVALIQPPMWARTAHTFSHIFAGGYCAGYYSYKWAEVLSADAYAAFEESADADGLPNAQTGTKYRQTILEAGGSRPAMESFKAFRGRAPTLDALLRHQGLSGAQAPRSAHYKE